MQFETFGEMQKSIMEMVNTILIEVLSTQAEPEYKKIKTRQKEGIQIAKENGNYKKFTLFIYFSKRKTLIFHKKRCKQKGIPFLDRY